MQTAQSLKPCGNGGFRCAQLPNCTCSFVSIRRGAMPTFPCSPQNGFRHPEVDEASAVLRNEQDTVQLCHHRLCGRADPDSEDWDPWLPTGPGPGLPHPRPAAGEQLIPALLAHWAALPTQLSWGPVVTSRVYPFFVPCTTTPCLSAGLEAQPEGGGRPGDCHHQDHRRQDPEPAAGGHWRQGAVHQGDRRRPAGRPHRHCRALHEGVCRGARAGARGLSYYVQLHTCQG